MHESVSVKAQIAPVGDLEREIGGGGAAVVTVAGALLC